jgi:hypothetical protein
VSVAQFIQKRRELIQRPLITLVKVRKESTFATTKRKKHESQTEEVNIYYIKASNGNPLLKIIDTPGFGDTRGISFVQEIPKKLRVIFES